MRQGIAPTPIADARWRIPIVLGITVFINYLDRNNLSIALPQLAQDYGWSDREVGANGEILLAAFYVSYALSNMLLSPLAERFGPKRSVIVTIGAFSLVTILIGIGGGSLAALIALRLLLGLSQGVHIPMLSAITSRWFLSHERSRANALWGGGILLATATAPLIIVPLIVGIGWRSAFGVLGVGGLLLSVPLLYWLVPDEPHSYKHFQHAAVGVETPVDSAKHYYRDRRFWLAVLGGTLHNFCAFGLLNWLPTYFNRAKGIDFEALGWPLATVFATGIVGMVLMAYLGDMLQHRMVLAGVGFVVGGSMVYLASTSNRLEFLVLFFAIAVFCEAAYGAQEYAIVQRLLPSGRVGAGTGLYNGLAVLFGGVGGSLIPGSIVAATGSFDAAILSIVVGAWLAATVMFILARLMRY